MRRVRRVLPASLRRRPRLVIAASLAVAVASSAGIVSVGALLAEHDTAWRGYQAAQTQLTAAEQSRDAAAAGLEQARTAALAAFTTARTLHDESTAHGVLLTAASEVARLGSELAAVTTTTGITVDSSGAASVAPSGFSLTASASSALDDRSGTSALGSATAALTAEIGSAQAAATELTAKTQAVTAATATLQTTTTAAANAEHVPVTGGPAGADPHCAVVPDGTRTVFVSIADQHLWACDGTQLRLDTAVTTGATAITNVDDSTPTGTFHIQGKAQNTVLRGSDANGSWNDPVTYWIPFMDGVGLHDASWQTFPYGSAQYTTEGSHACVHTPVAQLAVLYSWLRVGDRVVIS